MAAGHKLMKEITDQFLHCKICYEPYKEPKTLVCLHTFCTSCIQKHVDSETSRSSRFLMYNRYVTCPLCRSKTEIPTGGIRRLPDNFLLSSLTDVLDRKRVSKVPPCEICPAERPKANNKASHKCLDCAKLLCKSCVDLHMTTKVTQHHSLIDIEGEKDIECKKHPEEIVRYYCEPCEECVCVVCTFQEHRDHEICSFSDGFSKYRSGLDTLLSQCKDRLAEVQSRLSSINKAESSLKETRENIRDLAISYIAQVRTTERQLMQRVDDEFGTKVQNYIQNKEWLQENADSLQTTCNLAEIIINDRGIEMLLLKKEMENKLSTLLEPTLPSEPDNMSNSIKFVPGNVKLGDISMDPEDDADCDGGSVKHKSNMEEDQSRKRQCVTRDTQTEVDNPLPPIMAEMSFDIPTTNFSHGTFRVNGLSPSHVRSRSDTNGITAKTDVSVNTMCSMNDRKGSIFSHDESKSSDVCVKCCAELKKDYTSSTLPVIDGTPPAIQDIIITNCADSDNKERRRRRRSLVKSRRVQTDLSLSNESIDDVFSPVRASSQDSLNSSFRRSQNSLTAVVESVITRTIGTDPIDIGSKTKTATRNKGVNTTENVKVVVDTRSVKCNTLSPDMRESTTMTYPNTRTMDTQTLVKTTVNKLIATDYTGQRNKRTSTPIITTTDSSTCMPTVTQEAKCTWTDAVQTTERSVSTEIQETTESFTETIKPVVCNQGVDVKPEMRSVDTNTEPEKATEGASGVREKEKKVKTTKDKDKKDKTLEKKKKEKKERKEKKKCVDSCTETDPVITTDKETGTVQVQSKESWTSTFTPHVVHTGTTPARPATREASISTNPVVLMDQATHTNVVSLQDNTTETINVVCDGETLTERIGVQDAQTGVDVYSENVETITDTCYSVNTGCNTDMDWFGEKEVNIVVCEMCQEKRVLVDTASSPVASSLQISKPILTDGETQTSAVQLYDKMIATSCDFEDLKNSFKNIECNDVSTSTENLPFIGLLSDMDCDELILVPEVAIDVIGSDTEYEKIYKQTYPASVSEASAQTVVSNATLDIDLMIAMEAEFGPEAIIPIRENLVTVGVNTEQTKTFEKETCTPSLHHLAKGTNTHHTEKVDRGTTMDYYVKSMKESIGQCPAPVVAPKVYKKKNVSIETDPSLMDEKMIACINKLKTVSERLNSPTTKSPADTPPWMTSGNNSPDALLEELEKPTEEERKKNVMDLVAKSQAITRPKESKTEPVRRKAQPITTLKVKYNDKQDMDKDNASCNSQMTTSSQNAANSSVSKTGGTEGQKKSPNSRRNNSAPARIATVANQSALRKTSPKVAAKSPHTKIPVTVQDTSAPVPAPKQSQGPEFYSTVPKTRHPKQGLPIITESRPSSVGSEVSSASYKSAMSEPGASSTSSSDMTLDFSSLKITAPPRAPSASPTPPRHAVKQSNGSVGDTNRTSRPIKKQTMEVIPTIDITQDGRSRTGSTSSDQTDPDHPHEKKGIMKKLFGSKKKKSGEKRNTSPSKSPKPGRKALESATPQPPPPDEFKDKPKEKPKPFVYMRSRIFSIEQKDEDKFNKPTVSKYCVQKEDEEKPPMFDFAATFTKKK